MTGSETAGLALSGRLAGGAFRPFRGWRGCRGGSRGGALLGIACAALALTGCGDEGTGPTDDVVGSWFSSDEAKGRALLVIGSDSITVYAEEALAGCYEVLRYEIVDVDGDEFRLGTPGDTIEIDLRRDGEDLIVSVAGRPIRYERSTLDPATLPLCGPPAIDAPCAAQAQLVIGGTVEGELDGTDEQNDDNTHYDLYRVDIAVADSLRLEMSSGEVDSYLIVFDSAGTFLAENDDASNLTLDARLSRIFDPGCYIVMATSSFADETGEYTIELTAP